MLRMTILVWRLSEARLLTSKIWYTFKYGCIICRIPVDYRDYNEMTEQDCSQVVTHYGEKKFGCLTDVGVGPKGEVVIVDQDNKCVVVLDDKFNLLKVIGQGNGNSNLVRPDGVAVIDNIIAVSDYDSHQVKKYSLQGEIKSVIGQQGNKEGEFYHPRGLTFDKNNKLYVVDRGNYRVQVLQKDDTFDFTFGSKGSDPGQFQHPIVVSTDPNNSNVLVTDGGIDCIHIFSNLGQFIQRVKCDISQLYAFTMSPTGYLISGHRGDGSKISVCSPSYQTIKKFGKKGSKQGEFSGIMGMAMSPTGIIYLVEWNNQRLQVIK